MVVGLLMGQSKEDAIERLRKTCVFAMKYGDNMVMFIDKTAPDFKTNFTHKTEFPTDMMFNFEEFRKKENYKKLLRGDED